MMLAWLILAAVDCAPVPPAKQLDEAAARAYFDVAVEELNRGSEETGSAALRESLRLDPRNAAARARWTRLCAPAGGDSDEVVLASAARAVEAERYGEAAKALGPIASESAPQAALLYGIALYELGEDQRAGEALKWAEATPETADTALLFQGLLALRAGSSDRAAAFFDRAAQGSGGGIARTALELARLARRDFRFAVTAEGEAGFDSNVDQAPDNTPIADLSSDALFGISVVALARPLGERGPYLQAGGRYRNLLTVNEYDLGSFGGALGWTFALAQAALSVEYGYEAAVLGRYWLLGAHQVALGASAPLLGVLWSGTVGGRLESYYTVQTAPFSGRVGELMLSGRIRLPGEALLRLRYRGAVHASQIQNVAWTDHGGGARAVLAIRRNRVTADADVIFRRYGAADPAYGGATRDDRYLDGALALEHDVDRDFTIRFAAVGRRSFSNIFGLDYTRFALTMSLLYTAGLW